MMPRIALFSGEENGCFNLSLKKQRCRVVKASTDKNLLVCWNRLHVRGHAEVMAVSKGCFINSLLTSL